MLFTSKVFRSCSSAPYTCFPSRVRRMTSEPVSWSSATHVERTAAEPRDQGLHRVILSRIDQVNSEVRLLRLIPVERERLIKFQPGQWLDVHIPGLPSPGGFTITSPPSSLASNSQLEPPYLELAIQSTSNPPAAWLWKPASSILNQELTIRVGGSFVWPPRFYGEGEVKKVVFVAGGVGINPFMSMLSCISEHVSPKFKVEVLYSLRDPGMGRKVEEMLFIERIGTILRKLNSESSTLESLRLFLTKGAGKVGVLEGKEFQTKFEGRRIEENDLLKALGPVKERSGTVVYICGPPGMTDELVNVAKKAEGMEERHVLCEKWW